MVLKLVHLGSQADITDFLKQQHRLIFMYGPKCPPCQRLKPQLFEELALVPEMVVMGLVNAQIHRHLRQLYDVELIPYLIVFDGPSIKTSIQSSNMAEIRPFLSTYLDLSFPSADFDCDVDF
jgi:thioredoxin-like negative regulator of GroEL